MIVTITGANTFARTQAMRSVVDTFVHEHGDMALERLDGEEAAIERIGEALTSVPFLADRKMVVLREASKNKQFAEQAEVLLSGVPDTTDVVLYESKLDKRSSYYKLLKKTTDYQEYAELDHAGLARWLVKQAKEQGGTLSTSDANYIVQRVGTNQQLLASELEKLLLYAPQISRQSIEGLTEATPQSTIFELLDAAFSGNAKQALKLYAEQRALKVDPQQVIAMITWQLHVIALCKAAGDRSPDQIASEAKMSPYVVKKSASIARRITLAELRRLLADLLVIDERSKREAFNVDDALQHYILAITFQD